MPLLKRPDHFHPLHNEAANIVMHMVGVSVYIHSTIKRMPVPYITILEKIIFSGACVPDMERAIDFWHEV